MIYLSDGTERIFEGATRDLYDPFYSLPYSDNINDILEFNNCVIDDDDNYSDLGELLTLGSDFFETDDEAKIVIDDNRSKDDYSYNRYVASTSFDYENEKKVIYIELQGIAQWSSESIADYREVNESIIWDIENQE